MARNKIYAVVEGHGEADAPSGNQLPAVYVLIKKLLQEHGCHTLFVPSRHGPWRLRSCGDFDVPGKLEQVIRAHQKFEDCAAVLILRDLDDGCAAALGPHLANRIRSIGPLPFSVFVVCAVREYEAWFLASLETIHPGRAYPYAPETIRNAKGWLAEHFGYREVREQSAYTSRLDVAAVLASGRSRSFRRLYDGFGEIIAACQGGHVVITP